MAVFTEKHIVQPCTMPCVCVYMLYNIQVTDRLLPDVSDLLSDTGLFYIILLPQNQPSESSDDVVIYMALHTVTLYTTGEVCTLLNARGFEHEVVMQRRAQNEHLFVYRFCRRA